MKLIEYFHRARAIPLKTLISKILRILTSRTSQLVMQSMDTIIPTYTTSINGSFQKVFPSAPDPDTTETVFPALPALTKKNLQHEFDLLGSGWIKVHHRMKCNGILGVSYSMPSQASTPVTSKANCVYANQIWSSLSKNYIPIDWHLDFKSGYRWNELEWYRNISYGHQTGVDIKVPWELARMQHLPRIALSYGLAIRQRNTELADQCISEIQNQILDFIATNPPRFGVNWRCTMDVAIRAANWVLTINILKSYDATISKGFEKTLVNSLYDHGKFIMANLEKGFDGTRGNHFLANICGLAFISASLPLSRTTKSWLRYTHSSLLEELEYQFLPDGSNFEGSVSYHRLSAEMAVLTCILFDANTAKFRATGLNLSIPEKYQNLLSKMGEFSKACTKPDGRTVQIGDTDNGRFFNLHPVLDDALREDHLNHISLIDMIEVLFDSQKMAKTIDALLIKSSGVSFSKKTQSDASMSFKPDEKEVRQLSPNGDLGALIFRLEKDLPENCIQRYYFPISRQDCFLQVYQDFGVAIWKSASFYLHLRCGPVGQYSLGGHDHNDQLSIELYSQGKAIIQDPGTGIYTPFPKIRNTFRSVKAHFTPWVADNEGTPLEPTPLNQGAFSLRGKSHARFLKLTPTEAIAVETSQGILRQLQIGTDHLTIIDYSLTGRALITTTITPIYSSGYGEGIRSI